MQQGPVIREESVAVQWGQSGHGCGPPPIRVYAKAPLAQFRADTARRQGGKGGEVRRVETGQMRLEPDRSAVR